MMKCAVEVCDRPAQSKGMCNSHYLRRMNGRPLDTPIFDARNRPLDVRLWEKVNKTDTCWLWTGCLSTDGYGTFALKGKTLQVHRVAWELTKGAIPKGLVIDHLCRVHHCVRPDHLQVVTRKLNSQHLGVRSDSRSGVRGVRWHERWQSYTVRVTTAEGRRVGAGRTFKSLAEAEAAAIALRNEHMTNNLLDRKAG